MTPNRDPRDHVHRVIVALPLNPNRARRAVNLGSARRGVHNSHRHSRDNCCRAARGVLGNAHVAVQDSHPPRHSAVKGEIGCQGRQSVARRWLAGVAWRDLCCGPQVAHLRLLPAIRSAVHQQVNSLAGTGRAAHRPDYPRFDRPFHSRHGSLCKAAQVYHTPLHETRVCAGVLGKQPKYPMLGSETPPARSAAGRRKREQRINRETARREMERRRAGTCRRQNGEIHARDVTGLMLQVQYIV